MEAEIFRELLKNPIAGGGTIAGAMLAILYFVYKAYMGLRTDSASTDAVTTSLTSQTQVITMLREEVGRLGIQVQGLQDTIDRQSHERKVLVEQLTDTQQSLRECMQAQQKSGV